MCNRHPRVEPVSRHHSKKALRAYVSCASRLSSEVNKEVKEEEERVSFADQGLRVYGKGFRDAGFKAKGLGV